MTTWVTSGHLLILQLWWLSLFAQFCNAFSERRVHGWAEERHGLHGRPPIGARRGRLRRCQVRDSVNSVILSSCSRLTVSIGMLQQCSNRHVWIELFIPHHFISPFSCPMLTERATLSDPNRPSTARVAASDFKTTPGEGRRVRRTPWWTRQCSGQSIGIRQFVSMTFFYWIPLYS